MMPSRGAALRAQAGYTLIEVVIAVAISAIVMGALTSVILTAVRGADIASSRVEASSMIRTFQSLAYRDFTAAQVQNSGACIQSSPCTTQSIVLNETLASNADPPVPASSTVSYAWDGSSSVWRRLSGGGSVRVATDVTSFSWYVDTSGTFATFVIQLTVTVGSYNETQTFLFYPRVNP